MRTEANGNQETEAAVASLEEAASFGFVAQDEDLARNKKLYVMPIFMPKKDAVAMDELRIRRMKKGQDHSRSQVLCEALGLLLQSENASKVPGRTA